MFGKNTYTYRYLYIPGVGRCQGELHVLGELSLLHHDTLLTGPDRYRPKSTRGVTKVTNKHSYHGPWGTNYTYTVLVP